MITYNIDHRFQLKELGLLLRLKGPTTYTTYEKRRDSEKVSNK